jgi:hypothetical protein
MSWSAPSSNFWLFGGKGNGESMGSGEMNDLWTINSDLLLPIKLISFTGKMQRSKILLQWQAEDVNSSDVFVIERSFDGRNFNSVGTVAAKPLQKDYTFDDENHPRTATVFYRIKVMEQDNRFFYSKILTFTIPNNMLAIYPNPAKSQIWLELPNGEMLNPSFRVVDALGRISLQGVLMPIGSNRHSIDVSKLSPGTYTISIKTKKGTTQATFIKQ